MSLFVFGIETLMKGSILIQREGHEILDILQLLRAPILLFISISLK